jgi:alcohol dehydrogenase class IV
MTIRDIRPTIDSGSSSLLELRKFVAPEFVFGAGSRSLAGRYLKNFAVSRILLVTDPVVAACPWFEDVPDSLAAAGLTFHLFSAVSPNPRDHEVMTGAEAYAMAGCDALLAVGGGSVIDCAKGIGLVVSNRKPIGAFRGVDRVEQPMPPIVCVPTTGGTSADVSQFAIIREEAARTKFAIISKSVVPDASLVDPETLLTLDPFLTACTGIDALVHAIEAFVSNASSPFTELHALRAVRVLSGAVLESARQPLDIELRAQVMMGALDAGLAFSNASLGSVHALAHGLGGWLDLPHGECNALLLPHVVAYNYPAAEERYRVLADAMGLEVRGRTSTELGKLIVDELLRLRAAAGLSATLGSKGVRTADTRSIAHNAMQDPCNATNPRAPSQRDLEVILEEAL